MTVRNLAWAMILLVPLLCAVAPVAAVGNTGADEGWIPLFDGHSLDGWTASENKDSCRVEDGMIVLGGGGRSHLFYTGPVQNHDFKNFELKVQVKTEPGSNSGIFFHTAYQDTDWPKKGYEAQVNNTQEDWRKTGSLYEVEDIRESPVKDGEWFDYDITVQGKRIVLKVNGQTTVDYTEPEHPERSEARKERILSSGTFALQAHDPTCTVYYRDIRVKPLP
jgi:3-keto-disaccharide hydrolase